jgi:hypothetical protein
VETRHLDHESSTVGLSFVRGRVAASRVMNDHVSEDGGSTAPQDEAPAGRIVIPERSFVEMQLSMVCRDCDNPPNADDSVRVRLDRGLKYPKDRGYAKLLVSVGYDPNWAGFLAASIVEEGRVRAATSQKRAAFANAFRQLARPELSDKKFRENAQIVNDAMNGTLLLGRVFDELPLFQDMVFIREIRFCASGDMTGRAEIARIAKAVWRRVMVLRGRNLTVASAAHEYLLESFSVFDDASYTWSPEKEDFTDIFTKATREEFDDPLFSPKSAANRLRKKRISRKN